MSYIASPTRPRRSSVVRRHGPVVGLGLLVVLALGATGQHGPTADPPPAPAAVPAASLPTAVRTLPTAVVTETAEPTPAVPPRGVRVQSGSTQPAPVRVPATLPRSVPTRVRIPAIGVDSELVGLALRDDGSMEVPPGAFPAGWFTGAPTPGELGPAVLAGHVDYGGVAGVFSRLRDLRPGDAIDVVRDDGSTATFRVTTVEQHRKDAFPTAAVYGDIDHAGLRLITCGGSFDRRARSYVDNVVVFAELDVAARR